MEKMHLNGIEFHIEQRTHPPQTLIGFRKNVRTHEKAKLIYEDVIQPQSAAHRRRQASIHLKKTFGNLSHGVILKNLRKDKPGCRTFKFSRDYLTERRISLINPDGKASQHFCVD